MKELLTREETAVLLDRLEAAHPDAVCELDYGTPFQLLVAVILSAQCTDKRVNRVTSELFRKRPDPEDYADLPQEALEKEIYSCGFYCNKAKNIISCARDVIEKFGGAVPRTVEELMTLAGVGKKTANVVFSVAFGGDAIAVDTHVGRLANRLHLADSADPLKIEQALNERIEESRWSRAHHLLIFHGRYVCHSRNPACENCAVYDLCRWEEKKPAAGI